MRRRMCLALLCATLAYACGRERKGQCDLAALEGLAAELDAADPLARRDLVVERLGDVCKLPAPVTARLAVPPPGRESAPFLAHIEQAMEIGPEVCPAIAGLRLDRLRGDERAAALFDDCDLARFDLIDRSEFAAYMEPGLCVIPFYALEWLRGQGVGGDQARTFARALLLLDARDSHAFEASLPVVTTRLGPVPDGIGVGITTSWISVEGHRRVAIDDGQIDPAATQGHLVGPVRDELAEELELRSPSERRIVLGADARVPFSVIEDIEFTAIRAGLDRFDWVAVGEPWLYGAVPVTVVRAESLSQSDFSDAPRLSLTATGLALSGTNSETLRIAGLEGPALAALDEAASSYRRSHPGPAKVYVAVDGSVPFGTVARVLAILRGASCDRDAHCITPVRVGGLSFFD